MNPASIPNINIPRSKWLQDFTHSTSWLHGDVIPIDCFPIIPGDDITVKKAVAEIIMSTPIAPIFGNIKAKFTAFFVPFRLLWEHSEEFYGANKTSAGPQLNVYKIPQRSIFLDGVGVRSVSHYLGKPYCTADANKTNYGKASVLKERAYWFIVSEWYRAQQLQTPFTMNKSDNGLIGVIGPDFKDFSSLPAKVCKQYDIFTSATISPQYGAAVELPLGTYAPVLTANVDNLAGLDYPLYKLSWGKASDGNTVTTNGNIVIHSGDYSTKISSSAGNYSSDSQIVPKNFIADLSTATAAKINDIRYAFQLQKYLERANYGSRFFEVLAIHYGVTSPDARLQRPEYLGGKVGNIVVRTVLSQAGYDAGVGQKVGQPGASSITTIDLSGLFSKGFVEPGYVFVLMSTSHERLYSQGLMREDTKSDRFEFYSPEFANLGDQAIFNKEIMVTGDATDDQVFGYQGHWDEYRYRKNRVSGLLDPVVPNALDYWTLGEKFATRPSLSASFIEENRDNLSRALVTGSTGPDYIGDFWIQYATTREMPLHAIPGLVDHFGAL